MGRAGDRKMVSKEIKLLKIAKKKDAFEIVLEVKKKKNSYQVEVIENHGLFGVQFPPVLLDLLNNFSNIETQNIISEIKKYYFARKKSPVRQAA